MSKRKGKTLRLMDLPEDVLRCLECVPRTSLNIAGRPEFAPLHTTFSQLFFCWHWFVHGDGEFYWTNHPNLQVHPGSLNFHWLNFIGSLAIVDLCSFHMQKLSYTNGVCYFLYLRDASMKGVKHSPSIYSYSFWTRRNAHKLSPSLLYIILFSKAFLFAVYSRGARFCLC